MKPNPHGRSVPLVARSNRRGFLRQTAAMTAGVALGAPAILRGRNLNSKLNIAVIGSGGRGRANLTGVDSENIVTLCDVFEPSLLQAGEQYPQARKFADFRRVT